MIAFEFATQVYRLTDEQATLSAESLRSYAKGKLPREALPKSQPGGKSCCTDGALALSEFIEEALVGNLDLPLPLEGKAAEAMFWALRLAPDPDGSAELASLREALGTQLVGTGSTPTPDF